MPAEQSAPAKVNLFLHVLGRRPDGFHELDSLVAFASIADRVTVTPAERPALAVTGPFADELPADAESNLVLRAARALAEAVGRRPDVAIHLEKALPVAAGIGGGSAAAAA
ncbi:MAG: 4-(cytidine 5'-diphospho)-2-C-methyl-D-erythritol kinase, partial [Inquilinus sp.]|nr:4-(cytidine 5'-diphospho)-2-C-methyl-D-erythritol kinase [Inquilinus sp.]